MPIDVAISRWTVFNCVRYWIMGIQTILLIFSYASVPEVQTFFNESQETSYKVDEYTKSCVLLIGPLVKLMQEYIYNSILKSGSFVMDGLRAHYNFYNPEVIKEAFEQTAYHMLLGYAFIAAGLVALIMLPITCYMKFCSKTSINLYKYQICFCMEGFIFILASVAVFLSAASSLQTVVHVDEALQSHPELARNIINDLKSYQNNMQIQLIHLKHDLDKVIDFNLNFITDFPDKATNIAQQSLSAVISVAETTFTQINDKFQATCRETESERCDDPERKHKLVNALENVGTELNYVRQHLEDVRQKVMADNEMDASKRENLASYIVSIQNESLAYFSAEYASPYLVLQYLVIVRRHVFPAQVSQRSRHKHGLVNIALFQKLLTIEQCRKRHNKEKRCTYMKMLNWTFLYEEIYEVLDDIPKANTSVHILKNMTEQITTFLQPITKTFTDQSLKLKSWSNSSLIDFTSLAGKFLPNTSVQRIKEQMYQIDQILTSLEITSESNFAVFSGRAFLLLTPGLHSLILLLILSVACICGIHEINQLNQTGSESALPKKHPSFGAKILHCGTLFGLSFLWLNFLLAGLSYLTAMVMSMLCLPVVDSTIFKQYIDNPQVWDGYTWIDTQMKDFVNNYHGHIKMEDVLEHCALNQTVYNAFGMSQFWNITEKLNLDTVKINRTEFQLAVKRGITSVNMPDLSLIEKISRKIDHISKILDMVFSDKFAAQTKTLQDMNVTKTYIQTLVRRLQYDSKYNYIEGSLQQMLNIMSKIENYRCTRSIGKLVVLKSGISELKVKISAIAFDLLDVNSTMYATVIPQVNSYANVSITFANNMTLSYASHAELKLGTEVGNCHVLYNLYRKSKWAICDNGLTLVNAVWTSHGMMAVSMAVLLLLCCRIASYLRGAHRAQIHWQQRLELRRHERRIVKNKALIFGDKGEYVGNAILLRGKAKRLPHVAGASNEMLR